MPDVYEINVNVDGAPSGSERLANKQGDLIPTTITPEGRETIADRFEEQKETSQFSTPQIATATATAIGNAALRSYEQQQTFNGDSNRITQINDVKSAVGTGLTIAAGFSAGGPFGGLAALAWTAYNRSMENKQLLNEVRLDSYSSNYYQERLINDVTKRSR